MQDSQQELLIIRCENIQKVNENVLDIEFFRHLSRKFGPFTSQQDLIWCIKQLDLEDNYEISKTIDQYVGDKFKTIQSKLHFALFVTMNESAIDIFDDYVGRELTWMQRMDIVNNASHEELTKMAFKLRNHLPK